MITPPRGFSLSWAILTSVAIVLQSALAISGAEPNHENAKLPTFQTAKVVRADMVVHVSAIASLEPEEVVEVGSQVDGRIIAFGDDPSAKGQPIDFNSKVEKDQVLALIDDGVYRARLDAERAGLQVAEAQFALAKAKLQSAAADSGRALELAKTGAISRSDIDTAKANELTAKAGVDVAAAEIERQRATLRIAELNLDATRIKSPVAGVVIDRRATVGQSVTTGAAAPSLFLIASDLKKMVIRGPVSEAEIGQIQVGQNADCRVAAYPERIFQGKVSQVRLNAQKAPNVVTYTVVVSVDNPEGKLLPSMTAGMTIAVARHGAVLMVPNEALCWWPQPEWIAADARGKTAAAHKMPRAVHGSNANAGTRQIWIRDGQFVRPIDVQLGPTEGPMTEIRAGDLKEGQDVVVKTTAAATSDDMK